MAGPAQQERDGGFFRFLPFGRRHTQDVVFATSSLPHPDEIDAASDTLASRFTGRRPKYIESWNEHVHSAERTSYYDALQEAESSFAKSIAKNRRDSGEKRLEVERRQADLDSFDIVWAISQPTNHYRVVFYVYDHLKGVQYEAQRNALLQAFASRRPREKQEKTLQEVEKIYTELTAPLPWRAQVEGSGRQEIQTRPAGLSALAEHRDVFVASEAIPVRAGQSRKEPVVVVSSNPDHIDPKVGPLRFYPGWGDQYAPAWNAHVDWPERKALKQTIQNAREGTDARRKAQRALREHDEEWALAKDEDRVVFYAVENLQNDANVREELLIKFARSGKKSDFAAMLEFRGISYQFAYITASKLGKKEEPDLQRKINAQTEATWYKRFPQDNPFRERPRPAPASTQRPSEPTPLGPPQIFTSHHYSSQPPPPETLSTWDMWNNESSSRFRGGDIPARFIPPAESRQALELPRKPAGWKFSVMQPNGIALSGNTIEELVIAMEVWRGRVPNFPPSHIWSKECSLARYGTKGARNTERVEGVDEPIYKVIMGERVEMRVAIDVNARKLTLLRLLERQNPRVVF